MGSLVTKGRLLLTVSRRLLLTAGLRASLRASLRADLGADLGAALTINFS